VENVTDIPHAVLSEQFQKYLDGRRLRSAVFCTYKFDPGFFEKEILPVFLDIPLSDDVNIQLAQIGKVLRSGNMEIAVYYDASGLTGEDSARLDVRRNPIRHRRGIFHPKNVFLLLEEIEPDDEGHHEPVLIVACLSANLTKSGWWENVEVCHIEKVYEGDKTVLKDDVLKFLDDLKRRSPEDSDHTAVEDIRKYLLSTRKRIHKSSGGQLLSHFYQGGESLVNFLDRLAGYSLRGAYLEVISPYFDDSDVCRPLVDLIERFGPKEVHVFLPRSKSGEAECNGLLYRSVSKLTNTSWAKLPQEIVHPERNADLPNRFVHAKVYRFFTQNPKREICFVGSVNLTTPGQSGSGNIESGFLVDMSPPRRPDFWLVPEDQKVTRFKVKIEDDETTGAGQTNLVLRYHWDTSIAEAYWDSTETSPQLKLEARDVKIGTLDQYPPRKWKTLSVEQQQQLALILLETSFVTVHAPDIPPALILVQEMGMMSKPSLTLRLSVSDILLNWSLLTDDDRAAFIESRAESMSGESDTEEMTTITPLAVNESSFFDRFAGVIHAFASLERSIRNSIKSGHPKDADYRLFGRDYDSLGPLIDKVMSESDTLDDVERYVILSCSRQLIWLILKEYEEYWSGRRVQVQMLEQQMSAWETIRLRLIDANGPQFGDFLDWFDLWFKKKAEPIVEVDE
jgi:hypothetical protein